MDKQDYPYAHNDTSVPERVSRTAQFNKPAFGEEAERIRQSAFARRIPVSSDETLGFLTAVALAKNPKSILEIGTAVGVSGICLLNACKNAHLTTIEKDGDFFSEAQINFKSFNLSGRVTALLGDAGEILPQMEGAYDFIFLDGPKAQYVKYLPHLKRLLSAGGVLFADDVLLFGWVNGESPVPAKRKMLVQHVREYLQAVTEDCDFVTSVVDVGDGVALSVKKNIGI